MRRIYNVRSGMQKIRTKADKFGAMATVAVTGLVAAAALPLAAHAAPTAVIVTPTNTQGWSTADTRPGGTAQIIADSSAPGSPNLGALQLVTDSATAAKAQYMHDANVPLANVTELSYSTKQNSAVFPGGDASYQLATCLGGVTGATCNGFTTFVFEPYENGVVTPGTWQSWNVAAGQMWSSRTATVGGTCNVTAGAGGAPFYTLAGLQANCPNAVVEGFGVNIGTNNPSYDVEADLVNFNGTTYNFEPYQLATDKNACKDSGWQSLSAADGGSFKNQGACVSYVASGGKSEH